MDGENNGSNPIKIHDLGGKKNIFLVQHQFFKPPWPLQNKV